MVEDPKDSSSSSATTSEVEKKPQQQPSPPPKPVPQVQPAAAGAAPPRPPPPPPRPVTTPPPSPPARPPANQGRRNFIKFLVAVTAVISVIPFVPWGDYLTHTVGSAGSTSDKPVPVRVDNNPKYGVAAGKLVNVKDLTSFPPDSHWVITYPSSGDPTLDSQNPDTFVKFELIRLPAGQLGGDAQDAAAFVAFSKVCVHLWCSPNYNPLTNHEQYECPCHGSIYEVPDGKAVQGPASQQPAPTNAIPMLTLSADSTGQLFVEKPLWDVDHNGVIGYGRNFQSYQNYILPAAGRPPS